VHELKLIQTYDPRAVVTITRVEQVEHMRVYFWRDQTALEIAWFATQLARTGWALTEAHFTFPASGPGCRLMVAQRLVNQHFSAFQAHQT
jgi:hypothetical protein